MTDTLTLQDFGLFRDEIHGRFEAAYGFPWEPVDNEPETARRNRAALRDARNAVNASPLEDRPEELELLRAACELRERLKAQLIPGGLAWVEQVRGLWISAALVSQHIAEMYEMRSNTGDPREDPACEGAVAALVLRWAGVDVEIERAWWVAQGGTPDSDQPQGSNLGQIRIEIEEVRLHLKNLVGSLAKGNPAYVGRRLEIGRRALAACDALIESLGQAITVAPPLLVDSPFKSIFVRLVQQLSVTVTSLTVTNLCLDDGTIPRSLVRTDFEVPREYLVLPRTFEERRDALLSWYATCRPDFWESLPASCLRHRIRARAVGGRGQSNIVMEGVAAAMILSGFARRESSDTDKSGEELFQSVVARCRANLIRLGRAGALAVDPSGQKLPVEEPSYDAEFGEMKPGRPSACVRPSLLRGLPLRFDSRQEVVSTNNPRQDPR
jgi:hypothetical protein